MKAFKGGLFGCLGVGAAIIVVIIIIAVVASGNKGSSSGSTNSTTSATEHTASVLLDKSGNGEWTSPDFQAPDSWTIDYNYNCSSFGQSGNFALYVQGDTTDVAANQLGTKGSDTANVHGGGKVNLTVNSECAWHITAKG